MILIFTLFVACVALLIMSTVRDCAEKQISKGHAIQKVSACIGLLAGATMICAAFKNYEVLTNMLSDKVLWADVLCIGLAMVVSLFLFLGITAIGKSIAKRVDPEFKAEIEAEKGKNKETNKEKRERIIVFSVLCGGSLVLSIVLGVLGWEHSQIFTYSAAFFAGILCKAMWVSDAKGEKPEVSKEARLPYENENIQCRLYALWLRTCNS